MNDYIIGIDLGTTNCTVAYAHIQGDRPVINQFAIPQISKANTQEDLPSLPSFIHFPLDAEIEAKIAGIEWDAPRKYCIGLFARERGAELPNRVLSSPKSWLCHSGIDRREKLLPLSNEDQTIKKSPLEAIADILRHIREAWNFRMTAAPFETQQILITVPASFDPSARQLVQEAAVLADFPEIILLEEPQAAFYAWLYKHEEVWRNTLKVGDSVLVVDIGGGTTDFSLISVEDVEGVLELKRLAVGDHLLLGGDNIDLSLAYLAKSKFEAQGHALDDWQFQSMVHSCRQAKEQLLGSTPPQFVDITVMGRGSKLIRGTIKTTMTREEAETFVLDAFLPKVAPQERVKEEKRTGLQQIGLPYAQDGRISCQLAKFLSMTSDGDQKDMTQFVIPTAVLFNGGTMKAEVLRDRLIEILNYWASSLGRQKVQILKELDLDFAVSYGAVYYGMARRGAKIRIKSGTSRSYYIGVEEAMPAVPGFARPLKAICIVPFGMEEGTEQELPGQEFSLVLGEVAKFRFFSHGTPKLPNDLEPVIGTAVRNWKQELTELHPIETFLDKGEVDDKMVRVKLKSRVTELGVLELWCESPEGRKWKLEFDIREKSF